MVEPPKILIYCIRSLCRDFAFQWGWHWATSWLADDIFIFFFPNFSFFSWRHLDYTVKYTSWPYVLCFMNILPHKPVQWTLLILFFNPFCLNCTLFFSHCSYLSHFSHVFINTTSYTNTWLPVHTELRCEVSQKHPWFF